MTLSFLSGWSTQDQCSNISFVSILTSTWPISKMRSREVNRWASGQPETHCSPRSRTQLLKSLPSVVNIQYAIMLFRGRGGAVPPFSLFFLKLKYSWFSTNFCCPAEWLSYTHKHSFLHSFPICFITGYRIYNSSLCDTAGHHCLSTPNVIVCICQPQTPSPPLSSLPRS